MPRYVVTGEFPKVLHYRSARYYFELNRGLSGLYYWHVRKDEPGFHRVVLFEAHSRKELETLRTSPIRTESGSAVDKIMRRLVRDNIARELPE